MMALVSMLLSTSAFAFQRTLQHSQGSRVIALSHAPLQQSQGSRVIALSHAPHIATQPRAEQMAVMRPRVKQAAAMQIEDDRGTAFYLKSSIDAWAKLASESPALFALRVVILGSGLYFFGAVVLAVIQRAV